MRHRVEDFHTGQLVNYIGVNPRHKGREMVVIGLPPKESEYAYVVCEFDGRTGNRLELFHPKDLKPLAKSD